MRRDRHVIGFRHPRDLARLGQAAAPGQVEHHHARRAGFQIFAEGVHAVQRFRRADPCVAMGGVVLQVAHGIQPERVFVPIGAIGLQRLRQPLRHGQRPERMELHHDVHPVADRAPDLLEGLQRPLQFLGRDVEAAGAFRGRVEGPDLHARDALVEQGQRQFIRAVQEAVQVLIRSLGLPHMPIGDGLRARVADVFVAGAGVVDADALARFAAQHLRHRPPGGLAGDVPQRDVHRGCRARLDARAAPAEIVAQRHPQRLDLAGIAADQLRRAPIMQIGLDRGRRHEGLAQAHDPLIRVQPHPDDVGEFAKANGLERGDLHGRGPG